MRKFLLSLCAVLAVSACLTQNPQGGGIEVGDKIPSFEVTLEDGSSFSSISLIGTPSLIIFFHTTCPDCQRTLPEVQKAYEVYGSQVRFVAISREQALSDVRAWWDAHGIDIPFSAQTDKRVYNLFAESRIPRVYLVDKNGIVRACYDDNPCPDYTLLAGELEKIL